MENTDWWHDNPLAAWNRRMLHHSLAVIWAPISPGSEWIIWHFLTHGALQLLQGVLHQRTTINIQKFLSDDAPHGVRSSLKEFEYFGEGISCPGNIIQQFSSSHKLVLAIFGTLELHELLSPVIVRHQTSDTRDEVSMSSWCYQPAARIWNIDWARPRKLLMMREIKIKCRLSQRRLFTVNINQGAGAGAGLIFYAHNIQSRET